MNTTPRLVRKLSFESTGSIEFENNDPLEPLRIPISKENIESESDIFCCLLCNGIQGNLRCPACKGKGTIGRGSPFLNFLDAVMQFKLNGQPKPKTTSTRTKIVEFSKVSVTRSANLHTMRFSYTKKLSLAVDIGSNHPQDSVHNGIQCDQCGQYPIIGSRFRCLVCEEYDLCASCYENREHAH